MAAWWESRVGVSGSLRGGGVAQCGTHPRNVSCLPSPSPTSSPASLGEESLGTECLTSSLSDSNMATMGERPLPVKDDARGIAGFTHYAPEAGGLEKWRKDRIGSIFQRCRGRTGTWKKRGDKENRRLTK